MATRMSKPKWIFLYVFSGGMDLIQLVVEIVGIWFAGAGAAINEVLDPIVGIVIALFLQFIGGVSLIKHPARALSLVGTEALAAVTGGIAQFWILDVWYIHSDVRREEAEEEAQKMSAAMLEAGGDGPLYQNGIGKPRGRAPGRIGPANAATPEGKGIRQPGGSVVHR